METITVTYLSELIILAKIVTAFLLGAVIGYDREKHGQDAGVRTYAAVCIGATIFTAIAAHLGDTAAASRIVANIVMGVGFLGAGIITRNDSTKSSFGLTTAATTWCTAAVGVTIGLNEYIVAIGTTIVLYFLLSLHHQPWYKKWKQGIADRQ
ncbi:MgtC/SapB family protein [Mucilaginibacter hurinus]|uniref:MgtC/SapB family protein n=1 Tax=Mucilaginibacter hurinus TaxID=2201324 RepID=A0A367GTY4_9SPHI|nr:MgtC/SapB family protein [Mucilaginibacter hurinus]RCH56877.1 MgtC/SapB family protein [Mucilaginibacter hurinus]